MNRTRLADAQVIGSPTEHETGATVSEVKQPKAFEDENAKLSQTFDPDQGAGSLLIAMSNLFATVAL